MLTTKRKPASVGEILVKEFIEPLGLTQGDLAQAMGVSRKHVNELCNDRRAITTDTASEISLTAPSWCADRFCLLARLFCVGQGRPCHGGCGPQGTRACCTPPGDTPLWRGVASP